MKQVNPPIVDVDEDVVCICEETIALIPFLGVSNDTLKEACTALGKENSLFKFPNGIRDVLSYLRRKLISHIHVTYQNKNTDEISRIRDKILFLLEACIGFHAALPNPQQLIKSLVHYSMLPSNTCFAMSSVFKISDAMWALAGDQSTDFNYYTKRLTLSTTYAMSILHMSNDTSEGFAETLAFANRRIDNVIAFYKFKNGIKAFLPKVLNVFNVRFDK
ncbi:MAG: COQ9 family protein [Aaplasma endosymbiont of Hyalomma asiaticum]